MSVVDHTDHGPPIEREVYRDLPEHILELMRPWDNRNRFDRQVIGHIELAWRRGLNEGRGTYDEDPK